MKVRTKFEVRSFSRSWDNRGYLCPRYLFSKILMGFVWMNSVNVPAKFEVRSFTRSGYLNKFGQSLDTPFKVIQGH